MRFSKLSRLLALALLAQCAVGCAGRGDVSGSVRFKDKPLVFGTIQVEASDHSFKQTNINEDGTYAINDLPAGEIRVAVNSPNPSGSDFQPLVRDGQPPPPPRPKIVGWFPIPAEYQDLSKSQLTYTIKGGPNAIDIELK